MDRPAPLDAEIRRRHLLKHPFYRAWSKGELPLETLREYAGQYYHFESNFPRYVAGVYAKETDGARRRVLLENLVDEEGRSPTHPELWRRFARAIGARDPGVDVPARRRGTRDLLATYARYALDGSVSAGLGALYSYESIFPEVAAEKARGLRAHYGLRSRDALEFFRIHESADVAHSAAERALLRSHLETSATARRQAAAGVNAAIRAWWTFLNEFGA